MSRQTIRVDSTTRGHQRTRSRTQASLLKMLALVDNKETVASIRTNMVPVSISYEYDPCVLESKEFQLKRDFAVIKSNEDDLINMYTGIVGYKGNVCFRLEDLLMKRLTLFQTLKKASFFQEIANLIDEDIQALRVFLPTILLPRHS